MTIHLHNLKFFAFHGVHEEERILGGEFEVNADVSLHTTVVESMNDTVNYVTVYELIKKRMAVPTVLLEILMQEIISDIKLLDERINSISIQIYKSNPPIHNFQGRVGVSIKKEW